MFRRAFLILPLLFACAPEPDDTVASDDALSAELRVREASTTLWLARKLERETDRLALHGRTSRDLVDGTGFVFDDPYGEYRGLSARKFELVYAASELTTLASGVNQFIGLTFRDRHLTARATVHPQLSEFQGSGLYLVSDLVPVVSGGRTVYRIHGSAKSKVNAVRAQAGDLALSDVRVLDDTHFQVDLLIDHVAALADTRKLVAITAELASGRVTKKARLDLVVDHAELTTGDAYEVWPPRTCDPAVRACLLALPAGTTDLGSCGSALEVNACGPIGAVVDDVAFQAALARGDQILADPAGFAADAPALAGRDKAAELAGAARELVASRLQPELGRLYPDVASRDAALTQVVDAAIDAVYARPFDLIEPHTPIAGDAGRARDLAADALLAKLATLDLVHTEFDRPLDELTKVYRKLHIDGLRNLRTTSELFVDGDKDIYLGDWLGAHIEVTELRATGEVVNVLFEID